VDDNGSAGNNAEPQKYWTACGEKMITILYRRKPKRNPAMKPRITKLIFLNYF
jgi:hypothetical protein